jgi:predicted TIM-barrel fold metal-dependent hydrolase
MSDLINELTERSLVIDADRHTVEPMELWQRELPQRWKDHAPYYAPPDPKEFGAALKRRFGNDPPPEIQPMPVVMQNGEPLLQGYTIEAQIESSLVARHRASTWWSGNSPRGQLTAMDYTGIDIACLFPTWTSYLIGVDEREHELVACFARIYNEWLSAYCSVAPERLVPAGVIPRHDPAAAMAELNRVLNNNWTAIVTRPNPVAGRTLGHPDWEPLWGTCAEAGVAVILHEGSFARLETAGANRFSTSFAQHVCSHPMEHMLAFTSLLEAGVFERHPTLRVGFLEAGASWLPFWLHRLDTEYERFAGELKGRVCLKPSEYFKRQCWVSIEPDEPCLAQLLEHPGAGRLVFGSDYPHVDHRLDAFAVLSKTISPELARQIMGDNPGVLYKLPTKTTAQSRTART